MIHDWRLDKRVSFRVGYGSSMWACLDHYLIEVCRHVVHLVFLRLLVVVVVVLPGMEVVWRVALWVLVLRVSLRSRRTESFGSVRVCLL